MHIGQYRYECCLEPCSVNSVGNWLAFERHVLDIHNIILDIAVMPPGVHHTPPNMDYKPLIISEQGWIPDKSATSHPQSQHEVSPRKL